MAGSLQALSIWMNGVHVGRWEHARGGQDRLVYAPDWIAAPQARVLSLSLPFARAEGSGGLSGAAVSAYFANLLPDNPNILRRARERFAAASIEPFDLLSAIGRDCVGAVQLLPADESPGDVRRIDAQTLDEAGVARILREAAGLRSLGHDAGEDDFRLSIAGAQEKTALLWHAGAWCIPRQATPSTHIFKLPLGVVGNMEADMRDSVELEWLCMELARAWGLPVANVDIGRFEDKRALIVERFDRRLSADGLWWQRVPQEDMLQALGLPPERKYESDGGPGIRRILEILRGAQSPERDRLNFFKAQIVFWLLAATDGHAKNFSLELLAGGSYRMTPMYDILSTWPIQGHSTNRLDPHKARLAMAVEGRNRHYRLREIHRWHWVEMATAMGLGNHITALLDELVETAPTVMEAVSQRLAADFPPYLFDTVTQGIQQAAAQLAKEPDRRS